MPSPPKAGWCRKRNLATWSSGKIRTVRCAAEGCRPGGTRAQTYNLVGKLNGEPSAIMAIYQLPGLQRAGRPEARAQPHGEAQAEFPGDLDFVVSLDTHPRDFGGHERHPPYLVIALVLVIIVVFVFLQGWRAALIPLLPCPVSLIGTFAFFPDVRLQR